MEKDTDQNIWRGDHVVYLDHDDVYHFFAFGNAKRKGDDRKWDNGLKYLIKKSGSYFSH